MIPLVSLGRPSMNFRVTSRIASIRVADSPPTLKSFVNIDAETSSARMMSMPLASTCVRLFPSCGRAIAIAKKATLSSIKARRNFPARAALDLPIACKAVVEENVSAAAGPLLPRNHASNGIASRRRSNHGCAKVRAAPPKNQSRRFKLASCHELLCFLEEPLAVVNGRVVARELNQIAPAQEIFEKRFLILRERRTLREHAEKLERSLARHRQLILFGHVTPQDILNRDAELVRRHR